ncbi:MAG: ATP-binding cassette domain-containing protein [Deltaproteobacteria bacterium]|nr:ATP-binding cassette domain-containing protein [Deltaproteobacteria bacterium]
MIKVEHLRKSYAATIAVDDISFEVGEHEIIGFLGPNGAGKSTTLKVLTCSHAASSGRVSIDGKDVFEDPEGVKSVIGYLPENVPLYPELRVREYLTYRAGLKGVPKKNRATAIEKVISRCHLESVQDRIIGQLSKGYRQRTGLADALLADPKILILDEPTVGLDPNQIRDVRELIKELGKERTVILSSHILPEVEAVCSRVIIINKGRLVGQGKPAELRTRLNQKSAAIDVEVIDPKNVAQKVFEALDGVKEVQVKDAPGAFRIVQASPADDPNSTPSAVTDIREAIFDAAVAGGLKLIAMQMHTQSLEEIFVEIITQESETSAATTVDSTNVSAATEEAPAETQNREASK